MRIYRQFWGGALLVLAGLSGCGGGDSTTDLDTPGTPVQNATVSAGTSERFSPARVDLLRNGTVTWSFASLAHNVTFTSSGAPANIPDATNTQVARTFPNAGTFNYQCTIHPGMNGRVVVQ